MVLSSNVMLHNDIMGSRIDQHEVEIAVKRTQTLVYAPLPQAENTLRLDYMRTLGDLSALKVQFSILTPASLSLQPY